MSHNMLHYHHSIVKKFGNQVYPYFITVYSIINQMAVKKAVCSDTTLKLVLRH